MYSTKAVGKVEGPVRHPNAGIEVRRSVAHVKSTERTAPPDVSVQLAKTLKRVDYLRALVSDLVFEKKLSAAASG